MSRHLPIHRFAFALVLALAGCATTKGSQQTTSSTRTQQTSHPQATSGSQGTPRGPSAHALRAFEDAVRVFNETAKSAKPDWSEAERKFKEVVAIDEDFGEAYFDLGVIAERRHDLDRARQMYQTALAKKPSLQQAAENLAVMEENAGHVERATAMYQEMAQKFPQDGGSRARLAALYEAAHQGNEALKLAREALERDPKNLTAYKVMMRVYLDQKNYNLAELVALRAEKHDANDPELYDTVGQIALQQGDELRAMDEFRKAIKVRDDYLPARAVLASLAVKHHDWSSAAAQYAKVVEYQPKSAAAHVNLGIALRGMGQIDQAFQQYEQAKKLDENDAEVYYALGVVFEKNKSLPEKALENYKIFVQKAGVLPADHPVYGSIKTCEQLVSIMQQAAEQERQMKQKAELDKKMKEQEAKNKAATQPAPQVKPASASPGSKAEPAQGAVKPAAEAAPKPAMRQPPSPVDDKDKPPAGDEPPDAVQ